MNELNCEYIRDVYPDVLNGRADPSLAARVHGHMAACEACRADVELLAAVHAAAPAVPAGLHERVTAAVRAQPARRASLRPGLAMAATLAAALIGGTMIMQTQGDRAGPPEAEDARGLGFLGVEDAMLTGHATLEDLSVEQLEQLLGELGS